MLNFISCSNTFIKQEIGFGKASKQAIESGSVNSKRISCTDSCELDLIYQNSDSIKYKIYGNKESFSLLKTVNENTRKSFYTPNSKDLKNEFEECSCSYSENLQTRKESKFGFINENKYRKVIIGKASEESLQSNNLYKKKYSCIESAKQNTISSAIFELNETVDFSFRSPETFIAECKSGNGFETCSCDILLEKANLKNLLKSK